MGSLSRCYVIVVKKLNYGGCFGFIYNMWRYMTEETFEGSSNEVPELRN